MFRIKASIFLLTLYIGGKRIAFVTNNNQSCDKSIIRLDDMSILLDSILVELLFKINEDAITVKKPLIVKIVLQIIKPRSIASGKVGIKYE
jgi:hypothetical protein